MSKSYLTFIVSIIFFFALYSRANAQMNQINELKIRLEAKKLNAVIAKPGFYLLETNDFEPSYKKLGMKAVQRKSQQHYIVRLEKPLETQKLINSQLYQINTTWKLASSLRSTRPTKSTQLIIKTASSDLLEEELRSKTIQFQTIEKRPEILIVKTSSDNLDVILESFQVMFIDVSRLPITETNVSGMDLSVNSINKLKHIRPDLRGQDLLVSIKEQLFDTTDIDIQNRHFFFGNESDVIATHATEMASLIAGAGNQSKQSLGIAPKAGMTSSDFLTLLPDSDQLYESNAIFVQNHAYGLPQIQNYYGVEAEAFDQNTTNVPELIHAFSSGNKGEEKSNDGPYAGIVGYSNMTGNFKMAKNVIAIGSVNQFNHIESRSSKGPTYDGRIKPEFVGYGPQGTSDAAAVASGVSLLLQDTYLKSENEFPQASLVKAALMAGADDVGPEGIDFQSGFGNINAVKSLSILENEQIFVGELGSMEERNLNISLPDNVNNLKIALAWTDLPANAGDEGPAMVNDLDLKLSNGSSQWLPWVLNSFPHLDSLNAAPTRKEDHLNVMELITVQNPESGDYIINISSNSIENNQTYSVAYYFDQKNKFSWTYPTGSDHLSNQSNEVIRWEETYVDEPSYLEMNLNDSGWQPIPSLDTDFLNGYFVWNTSGLNGIAKLRMTIGNDRYESDLFTISESIIPSITYNCETSLGLSWEAIPQATSYLVKNLGVFEMETILETENTSVEIRSIDLSNPFISVQPKFGNTEGLRGETINYELQGVRCYYRNFLAFLNDDDQVELSLNLSTLENVEGVEIFKIDRFGEVTVINTFSSPIDSFSFEELDSNPNTGLSIYSAYIILDDGTKIQVDEVEIEYPFQDKLEIFPNPTNSETDLEVFTRGNDLTFRLIDLRGRMIAEERIFRRSFLIDIPTVSSGIYIGQLLKGDQVLNAKKILITQ